MQKVINLEASGQEFRIPESRSLGTGQALSTRKATAGLPHGRQVIPIREKIPDLRRYARIRGGGSKFCGEKYPLGIIYHTMISSYLSSYS